MALNSWWGHFLKLISTWLDHLKIDKIGGFLVSVSPTKAQPSHFQPLAHSANLTVPVPIHFLVALFLVDVADATAIARKREDFYVYVAAAWPWEILLEFNGCLL